MSVDEIIAELRRLDPSERRRVKRALESIESEPAAREVDDETLRRGLEAWQRLEEGLVEGRRTDLSQNIDEALYRDHR